MKKAKKSTKKRTKKRKPGKQAAAKAETRTVEPNRLADADVLLEALGGDKELTLFFMAWIACNRNATQAYLKLHPEVTYESARVLGARQLAKVNISVILESYDLGFDTYIKQLKDGLNATKLVEGVKVEKGKVKKVVMEIPDHKIRDRYHSKLGKLLDIENDSQTNVIQVNQNHNQNSIEALPDDQLDAFLNR